MAYAATVSTFCPPVACNLAANFNSSHLATSFRTAHVLPCLAARLLVRSRNMPRCAAPAVANCTDCATSATHSEVHLEDGRLHITSFDAGCARKVVGGDAWLVTFEREHTSDIWRAVARDEGGGKYSVGLPEAWGDAAASGGNGRWIAMPALLWTQTDASWSLESTWEIEQKPWMSMLPFPVQAFSSCDRNRTLEIDAKAAILLSRTNRLMPPCRFDAEPLECVARSWRQRVPCPSRWREPSQPAARDASCAPGRPGRWLSLQSCRELGLCRGRASDRSHAPVPAATAAATTAAASTTGAQGAQGARGAQGAQDSMVWARWGCPRASVECSAAEVRRCLGGRRLLLVGDSVLGGNFFDLCSLLGGEVRAN